MTDAQRRLIAQCKGRVTFRTSGRLWICTVCGETKKVEPGIRLDEFNEQGWKFLESHVGCKLEEK